MYEVKIYDKKGKLKKVVSADEIKKNHWGNYKKTTKKEIFDAAQRIAKALVKNINNINKGKGVGK